MKNTVFILFVFLVSVAACKKKDKGENIAGVVGGIKIGHVYNIIDTDYTGYVYTYGTVKFTSATTAIEKVTKSPEDSQIYTVSISNNNIAITKLPYTNYRASLGLYSYIYSCGNAGYSIKGDTVEFHKTCNGSATTLVMY